MGKLANLGKDVLQGAGDVFESMREGSKKIGEKLGYSKAGLSPKSDATKDAEFRARPLTIPMPDEEELRRAQRRRFSGQLTSGRASTVLTQQDDTLG